MLSCSGAQAQTAADSGSFPSRPLKLVVGASAGGNVDVTARVVANGIEKALGQTVVVENRTGAGGRIAFNAVRQAEADPYTLLMVPTGFTTGPALNRSAGYDPVKDFTPISSVSYFSYAFAVNADSPLKSLTDVITAAKAEPGKMGYGTGGIGSGQHLAAELFAATTGIKLTHIPYRGGSAPVTDLIAGQIPLLVEIVSILAPQAAAGKVRVLAVTGAERAAVLPQTPTTREAGVPDFVVQGWLGVVGPRGISAETVAKLNGAVRQTLADAEAKAALERGGAVVRASSAQEFGALIESDTRRWAKVVQDAGIPVQ